MLCTINKLKLTWQIRKCSFEPFLSQSSGSLMKGTERSSACQQGWKALISAVSQWLKYFAVLVLRTIGIRQIMCISVPLWLSLCTHCSNITFSYRSSWFLLFYQNQWLKLWLCKTWFWSVCDAHEMFFIVQTESIVYDTNSPFRTQNRTKTVGSEHRRCRWHLTDV